MRVVALIVVVCGCRVASAPGIDATTPHGDGLPERVITDAALWADVRTADVATDSVGDRGSDRDGTDAGIDGTDGKAGDGPGDGPCALLAPGCPNKEACYPFPFDGVPTGETRCFMPGSGGELATCQSQLECDGTTLCSAPGQQSDSFCLPRCDPQNPHCAIGTNCLPYPNYPGVGVCR